MGRSEGASRLALCPRCEQGEVVCARVKKTQKMIYICDECEAVWFSKSEIEYATFNYFNLFMGRQEIPALWEEIEVLREQSSK